MKELYSENESCSVMSDSLRPLGLYSPWNSPGQNPGVGSLSLLQEIFLTQGSNPGLPHCQRISYQLSHKGSPRILEWVAYLFSRGSSWPPSWPQGLLHCRKILYQLNYERSQKTHMCLHKHRYNKIKIYIKLRASHIHFSVSSQVHKHTPAA